MSKWSYFLYLTAVLSIVIPILTVLMTDVPFSSIFSHTVLSIAIILVIIGKLITIFQKRKEIKSFVPDVGVVIGLFIVLIISLI
ncbi:histidine kinase [Oceanobacillus sp. Castelsardo]|uniref:histidine kinase n=1 Tax=Oceanobacillus sp. Castelsardo TaxID=1851204 RepID=UPI000837D867|nr:histidine kinase [Oceanobacillus sp. Castelsardo]